MEIVDFLCDESLFPSNWKTPFTKEKIIGESFVLVNFTPEKQEALQLFEFYAFRKNEESIVTFYTLLETLVQQDYFTWKPIQKRVEELLYMLPVYQACP